jgi:hypothetical protein
MKVRAFIFWRARRKGVGVGKGAGSGVGGMLEGPEGKRIPRTMGGPSLSSECMVECDCISRVPPSTRMALERTTRGV